MSERQLIHVCEKVTNIEPEVDDTKVEATSVKRGKAMLERQPIHAIVADIESEVSDKVREGNERASVEASSVKRGKATSERQLFHVCVHGAKVADIESEVSDKVREGNELAAVEVAVRAMVENETSGKIQECCISILFDLLSKYPGVGESMVNLGVISGIVKGMSASMSNAALQELACRMLWLLAIEEKNRPAIVLAGGFSCVVDALLKHVDREDVVMSAFGIIKPLSIDFYGGAKSALGRKDASQAVARAMATHPENPNLQSEGCSTLSNLAVDIANQQVSIATSEEVHVILKAMATHPDVAQVQKYACFALKHLSFSPRNAEVLRGSDLPAVSMLESAAMNFPEVCKSHAKVALSRLLKRSSYNAVRARLSGKKKVVIGVTNYNARIEGDVSRENIPTTGRRGGCGNRQRSSSVKDRRRGNHPGSLSLPTVRENGSLQKSSVWEHTEVVGASANTPLADELMKNALLSGRRGDYVSAKAQFAIFLEMKRAMYGPGAMNTDLVTALNCLGYVCAINGDYADAADKYRESLAMQCSSVDLNCGKIGLAKTLTTIGILYMKCQDYQNAEIFLMKALDQKRSAHGWHTSGASIPEELENLGDLRRFCGRHDEAEELYKASVEYYRNSSVGSEKALSGVVTKLGILAIGRGDSCFARKLLDIAFEMKRNIYGQGAANSDLVDSLNHLGFVYAICGDFDDAIRKYEESLEMQRHISNADGKHEVFANTLTSLGTLCIKCGHHTSALSYLEEALDWKRTVHDGTEMRIQLFNILHSLGEVCSIMEKWSDSQVYFDEALLHVEPFLHQDEEAANSSKAERYMTYSDIFSKLGHIALMLRNFEAAQEHFTSSLEVKKSILAFTAQSGDPNAFIAQSNDLVHVLNGLGYACALAEDYAVAIDKYELSLKMQNRILGPHVISTGIANTLNTLGVLYLKQGSYSSAEMNLIQALNIKRQLCGSDSMSARIGDTLKNLGDLCKVRRKFQDAEILYEEAYSVLHDAGDVEDRRADLSDLRMKLGALAGIRGDIVSAHEHFQAGLDLKRDLYEPGAMNIDLVGALNNLGYACAIMGSYENAIVYYEESLYMQQTISGTDTESSEIAATLNSLNLLKQITMLYLR